MKIDFIKCILALILLLVVMTGCNRNDISRNDQNDSTVLNSPDSEVNGATILLSDKGKITSEIVAYKIIQFNALDSTMAYDLKIRNFDSLGHVNSTVTGDSSVIREETRQYILLSE